MSKRTIGIFFIINVIMALVGAGLIVAGLIGSTYTTTSNGYTSTGQIGNVPLFVTGVVIASLSGIPYLIAGPTTPTGVPQYAQYMPPQGYPQPPQNYPQQ